MKTSQKKEKLVSDLEKLYNSADFARLYTHPNQPVVRNWINSAAGILKNLDEASYNEFVKLSKNVDPSTPRDLRKDTYFAMSNFVGRKVSEFKNYDFSYLDTSNNNNWNLTNPLWLVYKLLALVNKHKLLTGLIAIIGLLGIDYSLAWKNTLWVFNHVVIILSKYVSF